jgi:hypothetical protein
MSGQDDGQDQAADPAEAIRRYCRSIQNALRVIDMAYPGAETITHRMRETTNTLNIDLDQLRYFMPKRTEN